MSYSVTENDADLSTDVRLSISGTNCGFLAQLNAARSKVNYGTITKAKSKSDSSSAVADKIFLHGSGNACTLLASAGSKTGESSVFNINTDSAAPFTLNKSNNTLSATTAYTGKVWLYLYDSAKSSRQSRRLPQCQQLKDSGQTQSFHRPQCWSCHT